MRMLKRSVEYLWPFQNVGCYGLIRLKQFRIENNYTDIYNKSVNASNKKSIRSVVSGFT